MPGITTTFATRSGPASSPAPEAARYFVAGLFGRGPTAKAQRCRSMAEVELHFGGRVAYGAAYDDLRCYFEEGGTEAQVVRVVGPTATTGFLNLLDRHATTPVATLKIDAISAGDWSTGVTVQVAAGSTAGSFKIILDGPTTGDTETYNNLTTPAEAVTALSKSALARAINLGSGTAAPLNIPAVLAATALSAGTDDRASVTAAIVVTALGVFGPDLGAGVVGLPGYDASLVGAGAIAHAKAHSRLYFGAAVQGASVADVKTLAATLLNGDGKHGGLFYPWVQVPIGGGVTKSVSPEGYAAGVRARAHQQGGPWIAAAGEIASAQFVTGLEAELTKTQGDDLNEANVNAIRTIARTTRTYGYRSLSNDTDNYWLLTGQDTLNVLKYACEAVLESFAFKTIDGQGKLLGSVKTALVGVVEPIRIAGGVFELRTDDGDVVDRGYSVDVGPSVNPIALLRQNQLSAVVAVRVSPTGETINLSIVKAGLTAAV